MSYAGGKRLKTCFACFWVHKIVRRVGDILTSALASPRKQDSRAVSSRTCYEPQQGRDRVLGAVFQTPLLHPLQASQLTRASTSATVTPDPTQHLLLHGCHAHDHAHPLVVLGGHAPVLLLLGQHHPRLPRHERQRHGREQERGQQEGERGERSQRRRLGMRVGGVHMGAARTQARSGRVFIDYFRVFQFSAIQIA